MIGIGSDVVDVDRFRAVLARTSGFEARVFTDGERAYAISQADPAKPFAARFAAKEAVLKSLGLGLGAMRFHDVEVVRAQSGQPLVLLHRDAAVLATSHGVSRWMLTLSHTDLVATATAVAL